MRSKILNDGETTDDNFRDGFQISFSSFGVRIGIRADSPELLAEIGCSLDKINPGGFLIINNRLAKHLYEIKSKNNKIVEIKKDGQTVDLWTSEENVLSFLQSRIRLTVAEYARSRVFLHAGAVAWKGQALIIPARSFSGKSSLVAALVKKGALYYSDDFAVLDRKGMLHPFHRNLSLRGIVDKYRQIDFAVETLGGKSGGEPLPVGMVLITGFKEGTKNPEIWKPEILSAGRGVMEMLAHTIPIRHKPKFSLEVLNKVAERAIICKSRRGDASEFADLLLDFFENQVIR